MQVFLLFYFSSFRRVNRRKKERKESGFFIVFCGLSRLEICTCDAGEIEKSPAFLKVCD